MYRTTRLCYAYCTVPKEMDILARISCMDTCSSSLSSHPSIMFFLFFHPRYQQTIAVVQTGISELGSLSLPVFEKEVEVSYFYVKNQREQNPKIQNHKNES